MSTVAGTIGVFIRADWGQYDPQPGTIQVVVCDLDLHRRGPSAAVKAFCEFISAWVKDNHITVIQDDYQNILIPKSAGRNLEQAIKKQFPDNLIKVNGVYFEIEMS